MMTIAATESTDLYEAALEAVLFVSSDPVSRTRLLAIFGDDEQELAQAALERLLLRYDRAEVSDDSPRGVLLEEVAGGLRFVTRPDLDEWLRRFFEASTAKKLSMGALETLSIVAYRQPVTAPEIQELRSVNPSGVLKTLLERRMVRIAGRKEVVGKPFLYTTTQEFLVHFGLKNLKDLPPLEEFEEALAAAGEGLGELLGGVDVEEAVLKEAAAAEDAEGDAAEAEESAAVDAEREAMEEADSEPEPEPDAQDRDAAEVITADGDEADSYLDDPDESPYEDPLPGPLDTVGTPSDADEETEDE